MKTTILYAIVLLTITAFTVSLSFAGNPQKPKAAVKATAADTLKLKCDSLAVVIRNLQQANDKLTKQVKQKDGQLSNKSRQIKNLKLSVDSLSASVATLNGTIDVCVDQYIYQSRKVKAVLNITATKKLPRKKLKEIVNCIEDNQ